MLTWEEKTHAPCLFASGQDLCWLSPRPWYLTQCPFWWLISNPLGLLIVTGPSQPSRLAPSSAKSPRWGPQPARPEPRPGQMLGDGATLKQMLPRPREAHSGHNSRLNPTLSEAEGAWHGEPWSRVGCCRAGRVPPRASSRAARADEPLQTRIPFSYGCLWSWQTHNWETET